MPFRRMVDIRRGEGENYRCSYNRGRNTTTVWGNDDTDSVDSADKNAAMTTVVFSAWSSWQQPASWEEPGSSRMQRLFSPFWASLGYLAIHQPGTQPPGLSVRSFSFSLASHTPLSVIFNLIRLRELCKTLNRRLSNDALRSGRSGRWGPSAVTLDERCAIIRANTSGASRSELDGVAGR